MAVTISVTTQQLAAKLKVADDDEAQRLLDEATDLLLDALATAFRDMPTTIADECVYRIARALRDFGKTSTGAAQVQIDNGTPIPRAPADPVASSRVLISRYVVPM